PRVGNSADQLWGISLIGVSYANKGLPHPESWVSLQRSVGAACPLLPGVYLGWDKDDDREFLGAVQEQSRIAADLGAMILVAIDARWIARKTGIVVDALGSVGQSVALVLVHPGDPLSINGAVQGLRRVVQRVGSVYLLRSDHGAIGALAFGARHAAVGLMTSTRHYAPPTRRTWRRPGHSARLFVRPLIDWYLASDVGGWTAAGQSIICPLPCCGGSSLARFLDTDEDADWHNMNALADLADYVIRAPAADRATAFLEQCRSATAWYGLAGFKGPDKPKAQLTGWVLS
ncbi:MAG: hypothetical protein OXH54_08615, partial [Acidimicrobiaceae bacterium]|nr:hypothetical protein [Acidimicrobiaceae bacterium]